LFGTKKARNNEVASPPCKAGQSKDLNTHMKNEKSLRRVILNPTTCLKSRQPQAASLGTLTANTFRDEVHKLVWQDDIIWGSWVGKEIAIWCYPPDKYKDDVMVEKLKCIFSNVRSHEEIHWQILWQNMTEEN
jgi:hypothetical protein